MKNFPHPIVLVLRDMREARKLRKEALRASDGYLAMLRQGELNGLSWALWTLTRHNLTFVNETAVYGKRQLQPS